MKKKLPVGIQDFPELIQDNYTYVDKTELIYELISRKGHFLSRPRRFGKSLLVSTLEAIFSGRRELFKGLWIDQSDYDWKTFPVVALDFSRVFSSTPQELSDSLNELLEEAGQPYGVQFERDVNPGRSLSRFIMALAKQERLVILIDEYDRPIIDHLDDAALCAANRKVMHDFFIVIKSLGKYIRYAFLTGVSKFAKVSLFSGMNNLEDISLHPAYGTLTGITEAELNTYYVDEIRQVAEARGQSEQDIRHAMRQWYNGYRFARPIDTPKVYNPVSVHLFLTRGELANYWFNTATPTFAIDLIKKLDYPIPDLESGVWASQAIEANHEVESVDLNTLLYQTGYLTIAEYEESSLRYFLTFPNEEVRRSFLEHLLYAFTHLQETQTTPRMRNLELALQRGELDQFFEEFNALLASIPYILQVPQERYYHSLLYLTLRNLGFIVESEVMTSRGRIDMVVITTQAIFVFEFKINSSAAEALQQIKTKEYFKKYYKEDRPVCLVGANFDSQSRTVDDWVSENIKH